jgi:ATP-dependent DNA ligase
MGPEGIVAKRRGSRYVSGRSRHWLNIKNSAFVRPNEPTAYGVLTERLQPAFEK